MNLVQKTILITGGGSGIGAALARKLAERNTVIICGRNEEKLRRTVLESERMSYYVCDIANPADIDALFDKLARQGIVLDVVINNAGVVELWDMTKTTLPSDTIFKKINTNLTGAIAVTCQFIRQANKQAENFIVNITSEIALFPVPILPLYSASKAGFHTFTQALRAQLKRENFYVIEVLPPGIDTDMPRQLGNNGRLLNADVFASRIISTVARKKAEFAPAPNARLFKILRAFFPMRGVTLVDKISRRQFNLR